MGFENEHVLPEDEGQHSRALGAIQRAVLPPWRPVEFMDEESNGGNQEVHKLLLSLGPSLNRSSEPPDRASRKSVRLRRRLCRQCNASERGENPKRVGGAIVRRALSDTLQILETVRKYQRVHAFGSISQRAIVLCLTVSIPEADELNATSTAVGANRSGSSSKAGTCPIVNPNGGKVGVRLGQL